MKPMWLEKFKDLPEIPPSKKWLPNRNSTPEQNVSMKILSKQSITKEEEIILTEAIEFYKKVIPLLQKIDFKSLSESELKDFLGYYNYIFNHLLLSTNELWCSHTTRLIKNADILGTNKSIDHIDYLKYPSKEIVKKTGKYNRANTINSNVFYGAAGINATLLETRPVKGELVTVGVWNNKDSNRKILAYPISFGKDAIKNNPDVKKGYDYFQRVKEINNPLLMDFMETIFDFLGYEFSKEVTHHWQYFYSAIYSDRIFENDSPQFEAIIYPSVQNRFKYENLAIRPDFFDKQFFISRVFEFEIEETYYEKELPFKNTLDISYVKPKNLREPKQIGGEGEIIW